MAATRHVPTGHVTTRHVIPSKEKMYRILTMYALLQIYIILNNYDYALRSIYRIRHGNLLISS